MSRTPMNFIFVPRQKTPYCHPTVYATTLAILQGPRAVPHDILRTNAIAFLENHPHV